MCHYMVSPEFRFLQFPELREASVSKSNKYTGTRWNDIIEYYEDLKKP